MRNASRGSLVEYIVAKALGIPMNVRGELDVYDLQMEDGTTIEIKSATSLQSRAQEKLSDIKFRIGTAYAWEATYHFTFTREVFDEIEKTIAEHIYGYCNRR